MILIHPHWEPMIREQLGLSPERERADPAFAYRGTGIRFDPIVPVYTTRWEFPREHAIIYEPSDEVWCRYFGIGREVETDQPAVFVINDRAYGMFLG